MSRATEADIIGTAPMHPTYVLVECPYPWAAQGMASPGVPDNLRALVAAVKAARLPVQFLLFSGDRSPSHTRIMVFRARLGDAGGYAKREFVVATIADVAPLLQSYLTDQTLAIDCLLTLDQDLFICTHGSHDKCCAKFGYPFYRQAKQLIELWQLSHVRVWQVSHIGGHRFAPTLVSFPEGRYYGRLTEASLKVILQRAGDIQAWQHVYRGWGILPEPVQVMERELILKHGWEWFSYKIDYRMAVVNETLKQYQITLLCQKPEQPPLTYGATVAADEAKTQYLRGSCHSEQPSKMTKYTVSNLRLEAPSDCGQPLAPLACAV
jgi:hypothetical protein